MSSKMDSYPHISKWFSDKMANVKIIRKNEGNVFDRLE